MEKSSENKYEKKQKSLIKNCSVINKKLLNAIKKANVNSSKELFDFLNAFTSIQLKKLQEETKEYLEIVEIDVKNASIQDNLHANSKIAQTIKHQTFIELNSNLVCAGQEMMNKFKATIQKFNDEPASIYDIKETLQREFIRSGGVGITYRNGAKVPLDKYFMMATRTARNETQNLVSIDDAKRLGSDLVYLQPNNSTSCKFCSSLGGRVYSISGKDKRFPALYDKLFKNGYHCIHPNCKCQVRPFFEEFHNSERNKELLKQSNREWNLDDRTEKQRQLYQKQQSFNHNQWSSKLRFEQAKEIYGKDNLYKSLKGFRIGKTLNSSNYQKVNKMIIDKNQFERWTKIIGKDNMPKTLAEFQDLKYNKADRFIVLKNKYEIEKINNEIRKHPELLQIEVGKQEKHIKGSNNYIEGKSFFIEGTTIKDIQDIVKKYATFGERQYTKKGALTNHELISCEKYIGYVKALNGEWILTKKAYIHYSKSGTHLVPTLKEKNDNNK